VGSPIFDYRRPDSPELGGFVDEYSFAIVR